MKKWVRPNSRLENFYSNYDNFIPSDEFYRMYNLARTGIKCRDFENGAEVASLTVPLSTIFDHGGLMSLSSSSRSFKKCFVIGKKDPRISDIPCESNWSKIMLASGLVGYDGGGALVDGKIKCIGNMITPGRKYILKALKQLEYRRGAHTRHTSAMAYSKRYRNNIVMITSHHGRCCILLDGRIIGQIMGFNGLGRKAFVKPCNSLHFPKFDDESENNNKMKLDPSLKDLIERAHGIEDIFEIALGKVNMEQNSMIRRRSTMVNIIQSRYSSNNLRKWIGFFGSEKPNIDEPKIQNAGFYEGAVPYRSMTNNFINHVQPYIQMNMSEKKKMEMVIDLRDKQTRLDHKEFQGTRTKTCVKRPTAKECILNAFKKKKKYRSLDDY